MLEAACIGDGGDGGPWHGCFHTLQTPGGACVIISPFLLSLAFSWPCLRTGGCLSMTPSSGSVLLPFATHLGHSPWLLPCISRWAEDSAVSTPLLWLFLSEARVGLSLHTLYRHRGVVETASRAGILPSFHPGALLLACRPQSRTVFIPVKFSWALQ